MADKDINYSIISRASHLSEQERKMLYQAEAVKQVLIYCGQQPGGTITISVTTDDGCQQAKAVLFDHAALVDSVYAALEYFQSEML